MEWLKEAIDYGIIGLMGAMSVIALSIAIERHMVYRSIKPVEYRDRRAFELDLTRKLHIIATVGSNAPYVGLLGTVLGIMLTFQTMGREGVMDTARIMVGLSLALKATAVGLLVAIPSIVLYNFLLRRVKVLLVQWDMEHGPEGG
jgi:biopolymer transport protein ExbB